MKEALEVLQPDVNIVDDETSGEMLIDSNTKCDFWKSPAYFKHEENQKRFARQYLHLKIAGKVRQHPISDFQSYCCTCILACILACNSGMYSACS